ncbi:MAG: type I methionyl aminopeptidase, partial [Patescibacteria group bacterium]|nr:type I methionyl aminopeptidase [Patescibacteria group bacterium]
KKIQLMREGGAILSKILKEVGAMVKPGVGTQELDEYAEKRMIEEGGKPAFKNYVGDSKTPFPSTLCLSVNDEVVHGPATPNRVLKNGDVLSIDVGMKYKGYFTDMAATFNVGKIDKNAKKLIAVTNESLRIGLKKIKAGAELNLMGKAIEDYAEKKKGFSVVRALAGHGVGKELHEAPMILNYFEPSVNLEFTEGQTVAIEPMIVEGSDKVITAPDGWTVKTKDGGRAAHFEVTLAVTKKGFDILTPIFW